MTGFIQSVKQVTANGLESTQTEKPVVSKEAETIGRILSDMGGCKGRCAQLAAAFGVILDEEIPLANQENVLERFSVVVPLENIEEHGADPVLVILVNEEGKGAYVNMQGKLGGFIQHAGNEYRYATPEEIDYFFENFSL